MKKNTDEKASTALTLKYLLIVLCLMVAAAALFAGQHGSYMPMFNKSTEAAEAEAAAADGGDVISLAAKYDDHKVLSDFFYYSCCIVLLITYFLWLKVIHFICIYNLSFLFIHFTLIIII